jgi:D-threo-aldose 1-dehydrogenase
MIELDARAVVGKTELSVPRLGVGTAPLGNMFRAHTDAEADAVLARAVAVGLRYFDTAPLYGHGLA